MEFAVNDAHHDLIAVRQPKFAAYVRRQLQTPAADQSAVMRIHQPMPLQGYILGSTIHIPFLSDKAPTGGIMRHIQQPYCAIGV